MPKKDRMKPSTAPAPRQREELPAPDSPLPAGPNAPPVPAVPAADPPAEPPNLHRERPEEPKRQDFDDALGRDEARDMVLGGKGDALTGGGRVDTLVVGGEAVDVIGDFRDVMPDADHPAVQQAGAEVDYQLLARRCYRASTGHGAARDRELLNDAAVALAELGGFKL